jgi:hypothetical protein
MPSTIDGNLVVAGSLLASTLVPSPGCITDDSVQELANIDASKLEHQHQITTECFDYVTTVAALVRDIHIARGAGQAVQLSAWVTTPATGGDRTVTVDLQRSTAGGAFATVMSVTVSFSNGSTARTVVDGTVNPALDDYIADDLFRLVVSVAGSAGNQAIGLTALAVFREEASA